VFERTFLMMRYAYVSSLVCVLLCFVPSAFAAPDWQALLPAVVKIEADQKSIPGAGCLIKIEGNRGYILTAYHVIEPAVSARRQQVTVHFYRGLTPFEGIIIPEWIDTRSDLAVLVVQNVPVQQVLPLGSPQKLAMLDNVIAIGHPGGSSWAVTAGQVSKLAGLDMYFFGAAVAQGNSGGPLLDQQGQMIGLNVEIAGTFGVAILADVVTPILQRWIGALSAPSVQPATPPPPQEAPLPSARQGKDGKEMILVLAGSFEMGSTAGAGDEDEKPVHRVRVDTFYMDRYEVTVKEYHAFLQATGHRALPEWVPKYAPGDQYPIVGVSWDDAEAYCHWAEKQLPTEAQWEKAARARMAERIRGGRSGLIKTSRITSGNVLRQWVLLTVEKAPMASTTWRATCGSGYGTGTMRRIIAGARSTTRKIPRRRSLAFCAAAGGAATRPTCAPPTATGSRPPTATTATSDSAV
jgi:hypothetical protein